MKYIIIALTLMVFTVRSCNSQKETVDAQRDSQQGNKTDRPNKGDGRPSIDDIFEMDTNNDGQLSKTEVKGPILNDFDKIDTNDDGFISREELQNAPKPQKGKGGGRTPRN